VSYSQSSSSSGENMKNPPIEYHIAHPLYKTESARQANEKKENEEKKTRRKLWNRFYTLFPLSSFSSSSLFHPTTPPEYSMEDGVINLKTATQRALSNYPYKRI